MHCFISLMLFHSTANLQKQSQPAEAILETKNVSELQQGSLSSPLVIEQPIDTEDTFSFTHFKFMMQKSKILGRFIISLVPEGTTANKLCP